MSMARREPKWKSRSLSWAGHALLVQRQTDSPSARTAAPPQAGQWSGMRKGTASGGRFVLDDLDQIRDHVAGPLDEHGVAHPHVLPPHLVLVVQAHRAHGDAGELDGLEGGARRERAGLADIDGDLQHPGGGLAGGELVGDGPARMMRGGPEPALLLEVVHLHHHAVGLVVERVAARLELGGIGEHRVHVLAPPRLRIHGEAAGAERLQRLPVRGQRHALRLAHVVEEDGEGPRGRHRGVLLAHGAGGGVAGIGEGVLAGFLQPRVELAKRAPRHVDLAAHLEAARPGEGAGEASRNGGEGGQGVGDVLAHPAVAAGGAAGEATVLVEQGHAEAVDLGLADEGEARAGLRAPEPRLELAQVVRAHGIVEGEHGRAMLHGGEGLAGTGAHRSGWGCRACGARDARSSSASSSRFSVSYSASLISGRSFP
jgi:hypothetical protein